MYESDYRRSKHVFQLLLHDGKNSTAVEKNEKVIKITHIVGIIYNFHFFIKCLEYNQFQSHFVLVCFMGCESTKNFKN